MSYLRRIQAELQDTNLDAFSRLRVSNPDTVFDSTFLWDLQPFIFQQVTASGGTIAHEHDVSSAALSVTTTTNSSAILQQKEYNLYIPGKSQLVFMTQVLGTATANVRKRVGYFDDDNGIFLEQNGITDVAFTVRTNTSGSPSDASRVVQGDWNLDTLDGNGPSGITLNLALCSILVIDFQWLGMGRVRVGFDIGGQIVFCHEFLHANVLSVPYMKMGNLPIRWEIINLSASAATMYATCAAVISEGGGDKASFQQFAYDRPVISAADGVATYAFSIRTATTFESHTPRFPVHPIEYQCLVTGNFPVRVEIYYGTTIGGAPSWTAANSQSVIQIDTAGTPSGGYKVTSFNAAASNQTKTSNVQKATMRFPICLDKAGTGFNILTVYVTGVGGASNCYPGITWQEFR